MSEYPHFIGFHNRLIRRISQFFIGFHCQDIPVADHRLESSSLHKRSPPRPLAASGGVDVEAEKSRLEKSRIEYRRGWLRVLRALEMTFFHVWRGSIINLAAAFEIKFVLVLHGPWFIVFAAFLCPHLRPWRTSDSRYVRSVPLRASASRASKGIRLDVYRIINRHPANRPKDQRLDLPMEGLTEPAVSRGVFRSPKWCQAFEGSGYLLGCPVGR